MFIIRYKFLDPMQKIQINIDQLLKKQNKGEYMQRYNFSTETRCEHPADSEVEE